MTTKTSKKIAREQAALDAEGERIGWERGMGGYVAGWAGETMKVRATIAQSFASCWPPMAPSRSSPPSSCLAGAATRSLPPPLPSTCRWS